MDFASKCSVASRQPAQCRSPIRGTGSSRIATAWRSLSAGLLVASVAACTPEGSAPRADLDMGIRTQDRSLDNTDDLASSMQPPLLTVVQEKPSVPTRDFRRAQLGQPNDIDLLAMANDVESPSDLNDASILDLSSRDEFNVVAPTVQKDFQLAAAPLDPQSPAENGERPPEIVPTPAAVPARPIEIIPTPMGDAESDVSDAPDAPRISLGPAAPESTRREMAGMPDNSLRPNDETPALQASGGGLRQPPAPPVDYTNWVRPDLTLVFTGQQHGYIEPCGCTGLERQKGGVARRYSFFEGLKKKGWDLAPIDSGNLIRRVDSQGTIKFHRSMEALRSMDYVAIGFGPDDVRLSVTDLIQEAATGPDDQLYASANVVLIDPELMPRYRIVTRGGVKVGITSTLDPEFLEAEPTSDVIIEPPEESTRTALNAIDAQSPDFKLLTFFGEEDAGKELVRKVKGFDLLVVSGGYGEPTFQPVAIEGSKTKMIVTGNKGMYAGLVGIYSQSPFQYARVPLTHEFKDAPKMRLLMKEYQDQLRDLGFEGLGLKPIRHPKGDKFVGSETCGKCHTSAFDVWESSPHFFATDSIVEPSEARGDVPRHFDPECISCHVTGWNAQNYFPYDSGYLSLEKTAHLTGNGCENCHGPGAEHSQAEIDGSGIAEGRKMELREAMQLPLAKARDKCMECHDLDNSPDFHDEDAFEDEYWPQVEHYGMD